MLLTFFFLQNVPARSAAFGLEQLCTLPKGESQEVRRVSFSAAARRRSPGNLIILPLRAKFAWKRQHDRKIYSPIGVFFNGLRRILTRLIHRTQRHHALSGPPPGREPRETAQPSFSLQEFQRKSTPEPIYRCPRRRSADLGRCVKTDELPHLRDSVDCAIRQSSTRAARASYYQVPQGLLEANQALSEMLDLWNFPRGVDREPFLS